MTKPHKIKVLYAWIIEHPNGEDGIPAFAFGDGIAMPLVGSDGERMASLRPYAQQAAQKMGKPIRLCKFSQKTVLEELAPQ